MSLKQFVSKSVQGLRVSLVAVTVLQLGLGGPLASPLQAQPNAPTRTPIKHVIVLIGENRTFDHLFATYVSKSGDSVKNLLSEGIINADGTPGKHFSKAAQFQAVAPFRTEFFISLDNDEKAPYQTLPEPTLNFSPSPATGEPPPFSPGTPNTFLASIEPSLETGDLQLLTTGASGAPQSAELPDFDSRILNFNNLQNGPFPLEGTSLPYDSYTGDTTHRLFEMWQQSDCSVKHATRSNPRAAWAICIRSSSPPIQANLIPAVFLLLTKSMTTAAGIPWRSTTCKKEMFLFLRPLPMNTP